MYSIQMIQNAIEQFSNRQDWSEDALNRTDQDNAETVSTKEIAHNCGKPLTKYERNMLIFNWLHALDETAVISHDHEHVGKESEASSQIDK